MVSVRAPRVTPVSRIVDDYVEAFWLLACRIADHGNEQAHGVLALLDHFLMRRDCNEILPRLGRARFRPPSKCRRALETAAAADDDARGGIGERHIDGVGRELDARFRQGTQRRPIGRRRMGPRERLGAGAARSELGAAAARGESGAARRKGSSAPDSSSAGALAARARSRASRRAALGGAAPWRLFAGRGDELRGGARPIRLQPAVLRAAARTRSSRRAAGAGRRRNRRLPIGPRPAPLRSPQ